MVAIVLQDLCVAGVDVRGLEASDKSIDSDCVEAWSAESSKTGSEGKEGMSCPSTSCIRLHTREGVSSIAAAIFFRRRGPRNLLRPSDLSVGVEVRSLCTSRQVPLSRGRVYFLT